ncbi:MAG TPA: cyclic nucleotide-binding domain-containing protein [Acidimicrobiales bacterium]|nr:cyclic nucleotide-binding domain-containing protein [Acidimicrobiales bacterium]
MLTRRRTNRYGELVKDHFRPAELKRLRGLGTHVRTKEGTELTRSGERGREAMLVLSGTAACLVGGKEVGSIGPGEFVGEVALLDHGPRTATVIAETHMELLVFDRPEFDTLVERSPTLARRMLVALAGRLRRANEAAEP